MIQINGIAHVSLTVSHFERCKAFYEKLLPFLGMTPVFGGESALYCVGGRTALAIQRCGEPHEGERFDQTRVGLHHVCFRARSRADVDVVHGFLKEIDAKVVTPPSEGPWAPGYYYLLFEDPVGIRLEINHVPGKGVLDDLASFNTGGHYR